MKKKYQVKWILGLGIGLVAMALAGGVTFASVTATPQLPHSFFGGAYVDGVPAPDGYTVTAVVDQGMPTERHYTLPVSPEGKYGGRGFMDRKLKVGGDRQGVIHQGSMVRFYVTDGQLPTKPSTGSAAESRFYAGDITRLHLHQP